MTDFFLGIPADRLFMLCLFVVIFAATMSLRRRNGAPKSVSTINFDDLLTDYSGRLDPSRCMGMGSWLVLTMGFLYKLVTGDADAGLFGVYATTFAPLLALIYTERPQKSGADIRVDKVELTASVATKEG